MNEWIERDTVRGSRSLFGLLEKSFAYSLGWYPVKGHSPTLRRTEFPSWSWAGWEGPAQWRDFHNPEHDERVKRWWNSGIIEPTKLDRNLCDNFGMIVSPVRRHLRDNDLDCSDPPTLLDDGTLQFWTSSAHVTVSRQQDSGSHGIYGDFRIIPRDGNSWFYTLQCDPAWRSHQPDRLEFIVIAASRLEPPKPPRYKYDGNWCLTGYDSSDLYENLGAFKAAFKHWEEHMQDRVVLDLMCVEWKEEGTAEMVQCVITGR